MLEIMWILVLLSSVAGFFEIIAKRALKFSRNYCVACYTDFSPKATVSVLNAQHSVFLILDAPRTGDTWLRGDELFS